MKVELVPDLIRLGMTEREAKLYVAMIEKSEWKSGELHRITGVPRAQTHQTLELMVSRQYCTKRSEGRFNYYRAIQPETLNEILTQRWNEEIEAKKKSADTTFKTLESIFREAVKGDRSLDFIEIVQTPHRIHQRFLELMGEAKNSVCGFSKSPYSFMNEKKSTKSRNEQTDATVSCNTKGLNIRMLFMYEEKYWDFMKDSLAHNDKNGIEIIRISDFLPVKMFVFDESITMLAISSISNETSNKMSQLIIHDKGIATLCQAAFETYWDKGIPFEEWIKQTAGKKIRSNRPI